MHNFEQYRNLLAAKDWQITGENLPRNIAEWLLHTDSLTEKLQQICQLLQVDIVQQGWQDGGATVSRRKMWGREVVLKGDGNAWIFAQTVLSEKTIETVAKEVLTLGDKPIGLWLFPQKPQRLTLEWRRDEKSGLYARRSQLLLKGYPLEIRELFLPKFSFESTLIKA